MVCYHLISLNVFARTSIRETSRRNWPNDVQHNSHHNFKRDESSLLMKQLPLLLTSIVDLKSSVSNPRLAVIGEGVQCCRNLALRSEHGCHRQKATRAA